MKEDEPLPLTQMVSIKNPVFWIFLAACIILFTYDKLAGIDNHPGDAVYSVYEECVLGAAFIGLFLTIAANSASEPSTGRMLNICCYVFEATSVVVLGALIFR